MAKTIASLNAKLSLDASKFQSGLRSSRKSLQEFLTETRKSESRLKEFAATVDSSASSRALLGGGIAAGAALIAKQIDQAAQSARRLVAEFNNGKKTAGEMVAELTKSVPILGNFVSMWSSIGGLVRDTAGAIARSAGFSEEFARSLESAETVLKRLKAEAAIVEKIQKSTRDIQRQAQVAGLTGDAKSRFNIQSAFQDRQQQARALADEARSITDPTSRKTALFEVSEFRDASKNLRDASLAALDAEKLRKETEKQQAKGQRASQQIDSIVDRLIQPFQDDRQRLIDEIGRSGVDLNDPRIDKALALFDRSAAIAENNRNAGEAQDLFRSLAGERKSLEDQLSGISFGTEALGGSAATGEVGTVAGASASRAGREGLARLQKGQEKANDLSRQLVLLLKDIRLLNEKAPIVQRASLN